MEEVTQTQSLRSDKMRKTPIGKLIFEMSMPAILSMLVQSLYNIVDSIFVANITITNVIYNGTKLGDDSFLAVSVVLPMVFIVNAVGIAIGVGSNAYISRKLGEGNRERANQGAKTAIVMAIVAWAVIAILAFVVVRPFVNMFVNQGNASDTQYVINEASKYLTIYMVGSLGFYMEMVCNRVLQATGNMKVPMICQLIGAGSNIVLDALFILGFGWGVTGAILATVIGQWIAGIFVFMVFLFKKHDVSISLKGYRPKKEYFGNILRIGLPAFVINSVGSVILILLNGILKSTANGIFILSAYFKVQSFVFMPIFGLMQGCMPIMSYNYGANAKDRFYKALKIVVITTLSITAVGMVLFLTIPQHILSILTKDPTILVEGAYAFRVICLAFLPAGLAIILINVLQAVNQPISSLLLSLSRQLLILLPMAYLLFHLGGQAAIWYCYPIAEVLAIAIFFPIALVRIKKQFAHKQLQYNQGLL